MRGAICTMDSLVEPMGDRFSAQTHLGRNHVLHTSFRFANRCGHQQAVRSGFRVRNGWECEFPRYGYYKEAHIFSMEQFTAIVVTAAGAKQVGSTFVRCDAIGVCLPG